MGLDKREMSMGVIGIGVERLAVWRKGEYLG